MHELDPRQLERMRALRSYDAIFADCPGSLEGRDILDEILRWSDFVIIPYDHEPPSIRPTLRTVQYVTERAVPYRVLLNNLDPRLGADHVIDAWRTLDAAGAAHFRTIVRQYRASTNSLRDECRSPATAVNTSPTPAGHRCRARRAPARTRPQLTPAGAR